MGLPHSTWKEQNTVYTMKRWDSAHSILVQSKYDKTHHKMQQNRMTTIL